MYWIPTSQFSDHSLFIVTIEDSVEKTPKPFRFLHHQVEHQDFMTG
ncbi:hypothetical protein RDI58_011196 [Solanum bulbocastanum]|uniref:Uncharacterized protein n=1 Tax=Solanum bulbocastanum TaxID=147425 RepID=A0AAN8YGQ3_SOLBU